MRKRRFSEELIALALRQAQAEPPLKKVCQRLGVNQASFFQAKKKFGGLALSALRELRRGATSRLPVAFANEDV